MKYFETLAEIVTCISESLNMGTEADYADLVDRRMMSLYGVVGDGTSSVTDGGIDKLSKMIEKEVIPEIGLTGSMRR